MSAGYAAAGGVVPAGQVHPEVPGGECVGHGGVALKLWVGLNRDQDLHLERMGQVECPQGRQGQWYFPLKTRAEAAVQSALDGHDGMAGRDVILRPISVTHVGLLRMLQSGHLYPVGDSTHRYECRLHEMIRGIRTTRCTARPRWREKVFERLCQVVESPA